MSANEEDPKEAAKQARRYPETEKLLRQFLHTDGPKGNGQAYLDGWDRNFGGQKSEWPVCCNQKMKMKAHTTLYYECQRCGARREP